ncbi:two-component system, response regulator YesN [Paenibacillus sp. RU4T]|nr:response regulator transcription factor [Paenibacillus sp. RU4T]SIR51600.1 two-component system, response regulator YesN [Paenibacillus sp. RU4X]SIR60525.1 two-component system, response regulator YesN [Paenibacillus sp. RU4T]
MYNVWIVDDEPFILEGLARLVDWPSLQLRLAGESEDGLLALEDMKASEAAVDILITDISMPEMNGLELIRACRSRNPALKCIILSGYSEFDYVREGMRLGIENYLLKPIDMAELAETLRATVEKLNRARIDALTGEQVELVRDNIMYRWMNGRISAEQWEARAEFLGLKLDRPYVMAAVAAWDAAAGNPETGSSVAAGSMTEGSSAESIRFAAAAWLTQTGAPHLLFLDDNDRLVVLLGLPDASAGALEQARSLLLALGNELESPVGCSLRIGAGTAEQGFDQAPHSYRKALTSLGYALLHPEKMLLEYEEIAAASEKSTSLPASPALSAETYGRLLLALDEEALMAKISRDLDDLAGSSGVRPEDVRLGAAEMVLEIKRQVGDALQQGDLPPFQGAAADLYRCSSLAELKEQVRRIARTALQALGARQEQSPVVRQIMAEIQTSYMDDYSLKTLGAAYHINPVYLGQLIHKETGHSFSDCLHRVRIDKAMELLRGTGMKTHDIAKAVGYWDTAHFYKHFKKLVGVPPSQFRRLV